MGLETRLKLTVTIFMLGPLLRFHCFNFRQPQLLLQLLPQLLLLLKERRKNNHGIIETTDILLCQKNRFRRLPRRRRRRRRVIVCCCLCSCCSDLGADALRLFDFPASRPMFVSTSKLQVHQMLFIRLVLKHRMIWAL